MFDQGEPVERAHVLLSGAIRIAQAGSDGGQVVLRFIGPGEIFGSVAIFTDHLYPADGIAMVGSTERSEEHTSELQSLMRISYAVFCLKKKITKTSNSDND